MKNKTKHFVMAAALGCLFSFSLEAQIEVMSNGRVEIKATNDATGSANSGSLEIANSLRIDGNEIITNTGDILYINTNNNGDVQMDAGTFFLDASAGRLGIGTGAPSQKLHVVGTVLADQIIDRNNQGFYTNPAGTSVMSYIDATRFRARGNTGFYVDMDNTSVMNYVDVSRLRTRGNTGFYMDMDGTSVINTMNVSVLRARENTSYLLDMDYISNVNYLDVNRLRTRGNTGFYMDMDGTSIVNHLWASLIYDRDNTGYYLNPNGTSNIDRLYSNFTYVNSMYDKNNSSYYCNPSYQSILERAIPISDNAGYCGTSGNTWGYGYIRYLYRTAEYYHSDRRIKENIKPVTGALETILKLEGKTYDIKKSFVEQGEIPFSKPPSVEPDANLNDPENKLHNHSHNDADEIAEPKHEKVSDKRAEDERTGHYGFIAQDVQKILPEIVVHDEETDMYSMSYSAVIPILVEALKEQQKQIDELKQLLINQISEEDDDK